MLSLFRELILTETLLPTSKLHAQQGLPALISSIRVTPALIPFGPMPEPVNTLPDLTRRQKLHSWITSLPGKFETRVRAAALVPSVQYNVAAILIFQLTLWVQHGNGFIVTCPYLPDGLAVFAPFLLLVPVYLMVYSFLPRLQSLGSALCLYALSSWVLLQIGTAYRNLWQKVDVLLDICSFKVLRHFTEAQAFDYLRHLPESLLLDVDTLNSFAKVARNYKDLDRLYSEGTAAKKVELLAEAAKWAAQARLQAERVVSTPTYWDTIYGALTGPTAYYIYAGCGWILGSLLLGHFLYNSTYPGLPPAVRSGWGGGAHSATKTYPSYYSWGPMDFDYSRVYVWPGPGHKYIVGQAPGYRLHHRLMINRQGKGPLDLVISIAIDS